MELVNYTHTLQEFRFLITHLLLISIVDLEEIGINAGNWVNSAQDRYYWRALVNAALNLRVPYAMELVSIVEDKRFSIE